MAPSPPHGVDLTAEVFKLPVEEGHCYPSTGSVGGWGERQERGTFLELPQREALSSHTKIA